LSVFHRRSKIHGLVRLNIRLVCLLVLLAAHGVRSATVTNIVVPSPAMKKDIPVTVILPDAYLPDAARLPVLYLLHGYSDNNRTWPSGTSIKDLADQYSIIVICPDGGFSSWYFDSPVNRDLHQLLLARKVPHDYTERPGGHNWQYWSNAITYQMLFISNRLAR